MTPLQQLQSILAKTYTVEDGETLVPKSLPGLTNEEVEAFRQQLPANYLPPDIEELVRFARGFNMSYEDILFTEFSSDPDFGGLYPHFIELLGDGAGNFWILDIAPDGSWGPVYYNCHETAVIIRHSDNLFQFLQHLDEWQEKGEASHVASVFETIYQFPKNPTSIPFDPRDIPAFPPEAIAGLPEDYLIANLTHAPNKTGFSWAKYSRKGGTIIRHPERPAWLLAYRKPDSWWKKIFSK